MVKSIFQTLIRVLLVLGSVIGAYWYLSSSTQPPQREHEELIGLKEKYEQLTKYTAKLEANYQSQKALTEAADKRFKEVVKEKNERISILTDATFHLGKHYLKSQGPDYFYETPKKTKNYAYYEIRLHGATSPPVGFVMVKQDGRAYKGMYSFDLVVETLQTVDETTGRVKVYSKAFWVPKENGIAGKRRPDLKTWEGERYPMPIVGGTILVDPTKDKTSPHFIKWAPKLNGGFNIGTGPDGLSMKPEFNVSLSGYGKNTKDLQWKILQIGVATDTKLKNVDLHLIPFTYRVFPNILSNTYIGPGIGISETGTTYFINTSVGF